MKNVSYLILSFVVIATVAIVSCSNSHNDTEETIERVTYNLDDATSNFNLKITFYNDGSNSLNTLEKEKVNNYLNHRFSAQNFTNVSGAEIFLSYDPNAIDKEEIALMAYGSNVMGTEFPIAFVFLGDGNGTGGTLSFVSGSGGKEHSCVGNPCACCTFLTETSNTHNLFGGVSGTVTKIIGCKCKSTPAECTQLNSACDHTVKAVTK